MASIIRVKRSTGTSAPATLNYGELALTIGSGTQANKGDRLFVGNSSQNPIEVGGKYYTDLLDHVHGTLTASSAVIVDSSSKINVWNVDNLRLDGNAFTSTDTDGHITITPNGTGRVQFLDDDELQFGDSDDIRLSYDTARDAIFFERGAAGNTADIRIADDIHFQFGTDNDARIYYDEASTDKIQVEGADWNYANGVAITISDTTQSTSTTTGALIVTGGVGIAKNLFVGGNFAVTGVTTITDTTQSTDKDTGALVIEGGVGIEKNTNIGGNLGVEGGSVTSQTANLNLFNANVTTANVLGAATNIVLGSTTGVATVRNATVDLDGNLNIDGGSVTSQTANLNLFNANVTTANVLGAGTVIAIGANTGSLTIGNPTVVGTQAIQNLYNTVATTVNAFGAGTAIAIGANTGSLTIGNPTVVGTQTTQNLYNTVATTVNAFGAADNIVLGAATGIATIRNAIVDLDGDLNIDGGDLTSNQSNFNLLNANVTTANVLGAADNIVLGAATGIATIRNAIVDLNGDLNINGGDLTSDESNFNLLNANVTTANVLGAADNIVLGATTGVATVRNATLSVPNATTINLGSTGSTTQVTFPSTPNNSFVSIAATSSASSTTTGALRVSGGVGIASDVHIGGTLNVTGAANFTSGNVIVTNNLTVNGNTSLGNAVSDTVTITGNITHTGQFTNTGGFLIDNVGIKSNMIFTQTGGGNQLFIDPFPDGLSNEGTVIIKGDLQVDGTTTTINSSTVSVNDAILNLGDVTSVRTVTETVASGVSTIRLDSVIGINTGDTVQGSAALPNSGVATVSSYNTTTKIITIDGSTSSGIGVTTQLTITHAFDTNTDRGLSFDYNTSSGTSNNKVGFFGYHDTTNANSSAPIRSWTYVPDATITNSVVTGTRGFLDIKGIYYQTGDYNTHGVTYFDADGLQSSTNNPSTASNTRTSTQILTAVTENTLTLAASHSVTAGDQITQVNNSGAYGVVKTTSSGTTITIIGVQGTFDTTNDLNVNGTNISKIPSAVTVVYTNKPTWTDTIDGGTF